MRRLTTNKALLLAAALAGAVGINCTKTNKPNTSSTGAEESGTLDLALTLGTGAVINTVSYSITGNGITPVTGNIDVSALGASISLYLSNLPAGGPYTIALSADSVPPGTHCDGSASGWTITAGGTTAVTTTLQCTGANTTGSVMVNGTFNNCPVIGSLMASPTTVGVGGVIALSATASDADPGAAITYAWSATGGGSFGSASAAATGYTCTPAGGKTITLTISDGSCTKTANVAVTCGAGGTPDAGAPDVAPAQPAYVVPAIAGVVTKVLFTTGNSVNNKPDGTPYRMVGIPDGLGGYSNGDGTFTVLMNHEIPSASGIARAHGSTGAFVSKWRISANAANPQVLNGSDLIQNVVQWSPVTSSYGAPGPGPAFNRFCAGDLAPKSAFYDAASATGFDGQLYLNGEEAGGGKAWAHGTDGTSWELPRLGKQAWENLLAHGASGAKTLVMGTDDTTPGQVLLYVGNKTNTGNPVERAGLTNGALYGVVATGFPSEISATGIPTGTTFTLAALGNVENQTEAQLETAMTAGNVTKWLRPEDGAWDPSNPADFYFVTTNSFTAPSRLWRLRFTDINNPTAGGTITQVLNGTEGHKMADNMVIDKKGHIYLQEDVGNNAHIGKIWRFTIATGEFLVIAQHNTDLFIMGAPGFLTMDEESSGMIDATDLLGPGWFITADQAHYANGAELFEGGQMLAIFDPAAQ